MDVTLTFLIDPTRRQIKQIKVLYEMAGWLSEDEDTDLIAKIISGSHCFMIAEMDDKIIGIGRSIGDGVSDAYIQDVTVKEEYRDQGVGTRIVNELTQSLSKDGIKWIGLIAEQGAAKFYKDIGFEEMPDAVPMTRK